MREILFRAKHLHVAKCNEHLDGVWVYGYLVTDCYINSQELEGELLVSPNTVCQYTGVCDTYDNKIFENDIVEYDGELYVIEWDDEDARFTLNGNSVMYDFSNIYGYECTVMGNIFDNPELVWR